MAGIAPSSSNRQRLYYHRQHVIRHKMQRLATTEPAIMGEEILDKLLFDSIKTICEEQGLKNGIHNAIIEPVAFESLRNLAEECMEPSHQPGLKC